MITLLTRTEFLYVNGLEFVHLFFCSNIVAIVEIAFVLAVAASVSRGLCLEPQVSKKGIDSEMISEYFQVETEFLSDHLRCMFVKIYQHCIKDDVHSSCQAAQLSPCVMFIQRF